METGVRFDLKGMKGFFLSEPFSCSRLVNRLGANIDMILIGSFIGAEALGIYNLAYQIVTLPVLKSIRSLRESRFPSLRKTSMKTA